MAGQTEIAISFDTTGSMSDCLHTVRDNLDKNIQRVLQQHPSVRFAIIAHGDYCDKNTSYVTKHIDFTSDVDALRKFVNSVEQTVGVASIFEGLEECYELVLRKVRTELSWSPGSKRAYVLIGDHAPHPPDFHLNVDHIDWRQEVKELAAMGIRGYAVYCWDKDDDKEMYETLAAKTGGVFLRLCDLANISDVLVAICKHQQGPVHLQDYANEVRARPGNVHPDMEAILSKLRQELTPQ